MIHSQHTTSEIHGLAPEELTELLEITPNPCDNEGHTITELAKQFNRSRDTIRRKVNKLIEAGKCDIREAIREDIAGRRQRIPVYKLTEHDKESLFCSFRASVPQPKGRIEMTVEN